MNEGFRMKQKQLKELHDETLDLLRYIGYTTYIGIPTKKGRGKKLKLNKYYPLGHDTVVHKEYTEEYIKEFMDKKDPIISNNGKLIGYRDRHGEIELIN